MKKILLILSIIILSYMPSFAADEALKGSGLSGSSVIVGTIDNNAKDLKLIRVNTEGYLIAVPASTSVWYNANGTTGVSIKAGSGDILRVIVGTAGLTSTISFYDDADGTCDTGLFAVTDTTVMSSLGFGHRFINGLCVITSEGTAAKITIIYR